MPKATSNLPKKRSTRPQAAGRAWKKQEAKKDVAVSYNRYKTFEGRQYTGMAIGRGHTWYYDQGEWKETKVAPDRWEFTYAVTKRRKGKAPEGSGAPVGTEYHWYILAHQIVRKLNANDYTTSMSGLKYKLAHKRFDRESWSGSDNAQRKQQIRILEEYLVELKKGETAAPKTEANKPRQGSQKAHHRVTATK
jgi:hypothetical protein